MIRWRKVVGYESLYQVSSKGRVRRSRTKRQGAQPGRLLTVGKPNPKTGYLKTGLWKNNKCTTLGTHVIVCRAFHGEPPTPLHEVNHKDGVKTNNQEDNLEWKTRKQNIEHARTSGLKGNPGYHFHRRKDPNFSRRRAI